MSKNTSHRQSSSENLLELIKNDQLTTQVVNKCRKVLVIYSCGSTNQSIDSHDSLFNYMLNNPNLCDKEYSQKINPNFSKDGFLITIKTKVNSRIIYKVHEEQSTFRSQEINYDFWKKLSRLINENYDSYEAFIIIHGTDTMSFTASRLSFMLENLNKTLIITGSQLNRHDMRNDFGENLVNSLIIAGMYHIPEVSVLYDSKLFRGNRIKKIDNNNLCAFGSPNFSPLVELGIEIRVHWNHILPASKDHFILFENSNRNIAVAKFFPMIKSESFAQFFKKPIEGVVLEIYGSNVLPLNNSIINDTIKQAISEGIIVVTVSQVLRGNTYEKETVETLNKLGVVNCGDMTIESAIAKLSYLLGKYKNQGHTIKKLLRTPLRGEISMNNQEFFSHQSNTFINSILKRIGIDENEENSEMIFSIIPVIINDFISKDNIALVKKFKSEIKFVFKYFQNKTGPLHVAARTGNLDIIKFLLDCKIDFNEYDEDERTPLNIACENKNLHVVKYLKGQGAEFNNDFSGLGFELAYLAYEGDLETLKIFFTAGADLMIGDYDSRTVAHIASDEEQVDILKFLIEETDCDIMKKDRFGNTPLTNASKEVSDILHKWNKNSFSAKKKGLQGSSNKDMISLKGIDNEEQEEKVKAVDGISDHSKLTQKKRKR